MGDLDTGFGTITRKKVAVVDPMAAGGASMPIPEPGIPVTGEVPTIRRRTPAAAPVVGIPQETPRQTALRLSPDPAQTDAKMKTAEALGQWLKMHPVDVYEAHDVLAEKLWGEPVKGQPPTTIWQRTRNMFEAQRLSMQEADLNGKRFLGDESEETKAALEEVKAQQSTLGPTLGWLPQTIVGTAYQLLYQGFHGANTAVAMGLSVLSGEMLGKALGFNTDYGFLTFAEGESSRVFGSLVGGAYGSMIDRGIDPTQARIFAAGLGALQVGLMAIPIGKAAVGAGEKVAVNVALKPVEGALVSGGERIAASATAKVTAQAVRETAIERVISESLAEGAMKTALSGAMDKAMPSAVGKYLGMDVATEATAAAIGAQGLYAIGLSAANTLLPEVAGSITNRLRVMGATISSPEDLQAVIDNLVQLKTAGELTVETLQGALGQFIVGAGTVAIHEAVNAHISDAIARETRLRIQKEAALRKAVPEAEPLPPHPLEVAAREEAAARTVGDVMDNDIVVPRPGAKAPPEGGYADNPNIPAWLNEQMKRAGIDPNRPLNDLDLDHPGMREAIRNDPSLTESQKASLLAGKGLPPKEPYTARPMRRLTEEEGRRLDEATRSEEGSADYIQKHPEIAALEREIADLEGRLEAGKEDAAVLRARIAEAKAAIPAAKAALKAQIAARALQNKLIAEIAAIDTSRIPNEVVNPKTGETMQIKGPLDELLSYFNPKNPRADTLDALRFVRDAIADGATPTMFPTKYLNRLNELSKYPLKKLPAADLQIVHDAIMAYYRAGRDEVIRTRAGFEMGIREALPQVLDEMKPERMTANLRRYLEENLGKIRKENGELMTAEELRAQFAETEKGGTFENLHKAVKNGLRWLKASNMGYESMISLLAGGEDSLLYQIAARPVELGADIHARKGFEYADIMFDWMKENKVKRLDAYLNQRRQVDVEGFHGELETGQVIALAGLKATEGGWDSLVEGGFSLARDKAVNKIYHPTEAGLGAILSKMTAQDQSFLKMVLEVGRKSGQDMAPVFRKMFGYDLHLFDPYYVIHRDMSALGLPFEQEVLKNRDASTFTHAGVDKTHTIDRVGSTKAVRLNNVGDDLAEIIDNAAMFVGLAEPVRAASKLIFNAEFATKVKRVYGDDFYRQLTDGLKAIAGTRRILNTPEKWVMKLQHRGAAGVLGFSMPSALVNAMLGWRSVAGYVPARHWSMAQALLATHAKSWNDYLIANSALFRQIAEKGTMPEMTAILNQKNAAKGFGRALDRFQKASMVPMKFGMRWGAMQDMVAAIMQARSEMKAGELSLDVQRGASLADRDGPNLTEAQRKTAEIQYAEYVFKRIHATPREEFKANMTREGVVGSVLSTLMSDRNAMLQLGIRKAIDMKTPNGGKDFMKFLLVGVLGEALAYAGIKKALAVGKEALGQVITGREPTEQEKKRNKPYWRFALDEVAGSTLGSVEGLSGPVYSVGKILQSRSGITPTSNGSMIATYEDYVWRMIDALKRAADARNDRQREEATAEAFDSFMSFALPLALKVPYQHGLKDLAKFYRQWKAQ